MLGTNDCARGNLRNRWAHGNAALRRPIHCGCPPAATRQPTAICHLKGKAEPVYRSLPRKGCCPMWSTAAVNAARVKRPALMHRKRFRRRDQSCRTGQSHEQFVPVPLLKNNSLSAHLCAVIEGAWRRWHVTCSKISDFLGVVWLLKKTTITASRSVSRRSAESYKRSCDCP